MKKKCIVFIAFLCFIQHAVCQIGIGTTQPDKSSILDIESTEKGMLIPRMTETERDAIIDPAEGLIMYNTTATEVQINIGTPSTPRWANMGGASSFSTAGSLVADCDAYGFEGIYVQGISFTASNTFKVNLTNNTYNDINLTFATADLELSGMNGIVVSSVAPESVSLTPGASQTIEYTLSGTPPGLGTLTATWNKLLLNCSETVNISTGDALFPPINNVDVASITNGSVDVQGIIDNDAYKLEIKVPYTEGIGYYNGYTGPYITNYTGTGENGDVNGFRLSYPAGTLSAEGGFIPVTVEVDGDESFDVKKLTFAVQETIVDIDFIFNGNEKGTMRFIAIGGILDRNYFDSNHKFVYLPVLAADDRIWLNNNLGAHYANENHEAFNPAQQATSEFDVHAMGSKFQWGRSGDGHELINYTGDPVNYGEIGSPVNGYANIKNTSGVFITPNTLPVDWVDPQDNTLWQGVGDDNNPCPNGFRVPTGQEFTNLINAENITDAVTAFNTPLRLTRAEQLIASYLGVAGGPNSSGYYWTKDQELSDQNNLRARIFRINTNGALLLENRNRAEGNAVRCIKNQ